MSTNVVTLPLLSRTFSRPHSGCRFLPAEGPAAVAERIARGDIEDGTPVRDIYRPQWSGLTSLDVVLSGLRVLEDHDWIRFEEAETGGRPSAKVYLTARARESV